MPFWTPFEVYTKHISVLLGPLWGSPRAAGWGQGDAWLYCCLQLAVPIGLSPLTLALSLHHLPPQAAVPIGLSPCALPLPAWPILTFLHTLPFPWDVLPTESPDCPRLTALCRVHTEEGNGEGWPGASKWTPPIPAVGDPSPTAAFGPQDVHLRGHFPDRGITTFCLCFPVLSAPCGERIVCSPPPQLPSPLGLCGGGGCRGVQGMLPVQWSVEGRAIARAYACNNTTYHHFSDVVATFQMTMSPLP